MNYNTIRKNFEKGLWPASYVKLAVRKGVITQEQCDAILAGNEPKVIDTQAIVDEALAILNGEEV
jgi:hypothetical protein